MNLPTNDIQNQLVEYIKTSPYFEISRIEAPSNELSTYRQKTSDNTCAIYTYFSKQKK